MQQQQNNSLSFREGVNLFYVGINAYAMCLLVFTRHSFGVEAFAWSGPVALALMFVYTAFSRSHAMLTYMGLWFGALVLQRMWTLVLVRRGWIIHSRYDGTTWLGFTLPFVRRADKAKAWEAVCCLAAGAYLLDVDQGLAKFVLFGSLALLIKVVIDNEIERKRVQRMRDAEIEMRDLLDRMGRCDF